MIYNYVLLAIFLLISRSIPTQELNREWPNWFIYPVEFKNCITGYETESETGIENAIKRAASYNATVIKGTLNFYRGIDEAELYKDTDYHFYYSKQFADTIREKMKEIDEFRLSVLTDDKIKLFSTDTSKSPTIEYLKESAIVKPQWIEKTAWEENGMVFGVGTFTSAGRECDAWAKAEENAIFNALIFEAVRAIKIQKNYETDFDSANEKLISYYLNHSVKNIRIVERYPFHKNKLYATLIKMPTKSIITKIGED